MAIDHDLELMLRVRRGKARSQRCRSYFRKKLKSKNQKAKGKN